MEFLDVVNENDNIIDKASKKDVYEKLLSHRIVHVFVFNDKGDMALQMRGKNVSFCPLHWCTAAGHVAAGESYEEAARREMKEEIGIEPKATFLYRDLYEVKNRPNKFLASFRASHNRPFRLNSREVEKIEFSL